MLTALAASPVLSSCGDGAEPAPGDAGGGSGGDQPPGDGGGGDEPGDGTPDPDAPDDGGDACKRNEGGVIWETELRKLNGKGVEAGVAASYFDAERQKIYLGLSGLLDKSGADLVSTHSLVAVSTRDEKPRWEKRHAGEYVGVLEFVAGLGVNPDGSIITSVREVRGLVGDASNPTAIFQSWLGLYSEDGVELDEAVFEQTEANPDSVGPVPSVGAGIVGGGYIEAGSTDFSAENLPGSAFKAYFRSYDASLKPTNTFYYAAKDVDVSKGGYTDVREVASIEGGDIVALVEGHRTNQDTHVHMVRFSSDGKEQWDVDLGSLIEYDPSSIFVHDNGEIWVSGAHNHYKGEVPKDPSKVEVTWRKYWVARFSADGKPQSSFEGAAPESSMANPDNAAIAMDVAIDRVGNIWLAGTYSMTIRDAPEGLECQHYAWAKKLDPQGEELWHTEMLTDEFKNRSDKAVSIQVDDECNGYLVSNYTRVGDSADHCKLVPAVAKIKP